MNPYKVVEEFEAAIAEWSGARYGVAVESGTAALFLSLMYSRPLGCVEIPKRTYPSVPCSVIHAGGTVKFTDEEWIGDYQLRPTNVVDGALRFRKNMYKGGLHCLSFHVKKHLPIGRGGMILTDDRDASSWFKRARFDGRGPVPLFEDNLTMIGWNFYLEPSQAVRGLQLFQTIQDKDLPDLDVSEQGYPDLSKFPIYTQQ